MIKITEIQEELQRRIGQKRVIVIIDLKVERFYGQLFPFEKITIEASEQNKTLETAESIVGQLVTMKADRDVFLLGVGGGITTDICGFVAAIYKRGVDFGFVPTTLLAMIDAAIGGKNGVNVQHFKNMVGTIRQPEFTLICPEFLQTLSHSEFYEGLSEMFKAFIISGENFDECGRFFAENDEKTIFALPENLVKLEFYIQEAIKVKQLIVAEDEFETDKRRILNLGHTFAHAIEHCSTLSHGQSVAIGLVCAARNGNPAVAERISRALSACGLPTEIPADIPRQQMLEAIAQDKKNSDGACNIIVINDIGDVAIRKLKAGILV